MQFILTPTGHSSAIPVQYITMESATSTDRHHADLAELQLWLRGIEYHDENEDGIAELQLFFKIRDDAEKMKRIFDELKKDDVIDILSSFVTTNINPCENFDDDWRGLGTWGNSGFNVGWSWNDQHQGITLAANFRT